ncbi:tail assembly protein [Pseudomonas phage MP1412]|uniref:Tail assembly structural protein n=1 Tax=Pseudomonas phage MP1412 TaxID=1204517 RepID=I6WN02_9CAUD|nr:tail assembly protein [Pseudomonas phage MP1412]AFN39643.1 tail assembly structural protein [Pseudomonas phage MP1412]
MAVITTYGLMEVLYGRSSGPDLTPALDSLTSANYQPPGIVTPATALPGAGSIVRNEPISEIPQAYSAWRMPTFLDDYYNRIHIRPSNVNLGNLVSEQQFAIEVWNGFFNNRYLQNIQVQNGGGISLVGAAPPATWAALETKTYQLTVTTDGPPDINAIFRFDWDGTADDANLTVLGSRIVALPYIFEAPAKEVLEWKTDVLTTNDGSEQRVRLRKKPRQSFNVTYPIPYREMARAENLVYGWLTRRWAVALWSEAQQVGTLLAGTTVINIDTTASDYRDGALIMIWESNRKSATADVGIVSAGTLTLNRPLAETFNNPWIVPVRLGRIVGNVSRATSGYNGSLEMTYEFSDNIDLDPPAAPTQFLGYDVYFDEALKNGEALTDSLQARVDVVDYGTAAGASFYSPWTYTRIGRPYKFLLQGLQDIWNFRKFLHRRAGRLRPFWVPTFENNMRVAQTGELTQSIEVYADDYREFAPERTHIGILLDDGTWLLRTINAATASGTDTAVIGLDAPININASRIRQISFLGLKRLDADRVELQWNSNRVLECTVRMMEIQP